MTNPLTAITDEQARKLLYDLCGGAIDEDSGIAHIRGFLTAAERNNNA